MGIIMSITRAWTVKLSIAQFEQALLKFKKAAIPVHGFRAPYMRFNENTNKATKENDLQWVSHTIVFFRHLESIQRMGRTAQITNWIQSFYTCKMEDETPSIPWWGDHCLEIPVSCPDDEVLVDRYGMHDANEIAAVMLDMLQTSHQNGELVNFLFHPERVGLITPVIETLLQEALSRTELWVCSLDDISQWWHERAKCTFDIVEERTNCFRVNVRGSHRGSALLQKPHGVTDFISCEKDGSFVLHSPLRPAVNILPGFCEKGAPCLKNEGFAVETAPDPGCHAVSLSRSLTLFRQNGPSEVRKTA